MTSRRNTRQAEPPPHPAADDNANTPEGPAILFPPATAAVLETLTRQQERQRADLATTDAQIGAIIGTARAIMQPPDEWIVTTRGFFPPEAQPPTA